MENDTQQSGKSIELDEWGELFSEIAPTTGVRLENAFSFDADGDDPPPEKIYHVRNTRYDRKFQKSEAARKRVEQFVVDNGDQSDWTQKQKQDFAILNKQCERAQEKYIKELHFHETEGGRALAKIDDYRANEGREERNAKRRKVRANPNLKPSKMSNDEKKLHAEERKAKNSDGEWVRRQRLKGASEEEIAVGLRLRVEIRAAERAVQSNPNFGIF